MNEFRIVSIADPLADPSVTSLCFRLISRGQVMSFLPSDLNGEGRLDLSLIRRIGDCLSASGVAQEPGLELVRVAQPAQWEVVRGQQALERAIEAVDASPQPAGEWEPAREVLGDDLLARLLAISTSSLRRYAGGERQTPDAVAWRLHVVARILAALLGSYNAYGIRRWFERQRVALGGVAPVIVIASASSEDDERLLVVVDLAESLVGAAAAA